MNEKGLPPALNGDASLEEVFAGLKPSLPPTCGFSSRCSYVTHGISLILKKNKAFISSRNLEKQFSEDYLDELTGGRWMIYRERLEISLCGLFPGLRACKGEVARTCFVGRCPGTL